jgi:PAS domain S-box-containing protein
MPVLNYVVCNSVLICTPHTLLKEILIYMGQVGKYGGVKNESDQAIFNWNTSRCCQVRIVHEGLFTTTKTLASNKDFFANKINTPIDCIYVVEGTQFLGILTIIDLIKLINSAINLTDLTIVEVMQQPLITLKPDFDVNATLTLMCQLGIRHLAVIDHQEQFSGIVTLESLARELQKELVKTQEQLQSEIAQRCSIELALKKSESELEKRVNQATEALVKVNQDLHKRICDRIVTEAQLLQTTSEFQEIFQAFPDLYFRLESDGKILSYHTRQDSEFHLPTYPFIGKYIQDILPFDVGHQFHQGLQQCNQTKSLEVIEYSLALADEEESFEARLLPSIQEQIIVIVRNITKNKQALYISEERYTRAISAGKVGLWEWNIQTNKIYIDPNFLTMLGYTEQEIPTSFDEWLLLVHPDDIPSVKNAINDSLSSLTLKYEIEHRMLDKYGNYIWFLARGTILRDDKGIPCFMAGSNTDITARKQAENKLKSSLKEKEVLLKEIHHRVKNNLQIISSLLRLQAKYIHDEKASNIFQDSQHRIRAMAMIHENLYQSNNLAKIEVYDYVHKLTNNLICSYGVKPDMQIYLNIDNISLKIDTAIPCGLIINELVSNAIKHAFINTDKGDIFVSFLDLHDGQYSLTVSDNGIGLQQDIEVYKNQSLGLQLVWNLVEQLAGSITFTQKPSTLFTITFTEQH